VPKRLPHGLGLLLALTVCASAQTQNADGLFLKIDKLTPDVIAAVAKIGEERIVPAPAGTDVLKLVSQYCGSANARRSYLQLFIAANAEVEDIKASRTILTRDTPLKLPACIYSDERVVAVPVDQVGPRWDKPVAPTAQTVEALTAARVVPTSGGRSPASVQPEDTAPETPGQTKWNPLTQQITIQSADRLPGQGLDLGRLAAAGARGLPDQLSMLGIAITKVLDSTRLIDPEVKDQYDRLVSRVIASLDKGDDAWKRNTMQLASLERVFRTQDVLASNETTNFTRLPTGAALLSSDFAPGTFHVSVKPGLEAKTAALELSNAIKASNPNAAIGIPSKYVSYFATPQTAETTEQCKPKPGQPWPFDANELKKVLELRTLAERPTRFGKMLILDAGFPPGAVGTSPFEKRYFLRDAFAPSGDGAQPYLWTQTIENGKPVYYVPGIKFSGHGVEVLTLALGGVDALGRRLLASVGTLDSGHVIQWMGYSGAGGVLQLRGDAIAGSISGANENRAIANVVNLSLSFELDSDNSFLKRSVKDRNYVLFVFAAGNESEPLVQQNPATWGGATTENVITVGASRPDGSYAGFSNYNVLTVDMAAPGCGVPTLTWNDTQAKFESIVLDGTSLAAPLVSFAANLLHGDYAGSIKRLKSRLISSGRFSESVAAKTWSGRILDVPVAVASPFDAVRKKDGSLRLGRIEWPEAGKVVCGKMRSQRGVRQIHVATEAADKVSILYYDIERTGISPEPVCKLASGELAQIPFREAVVREGQVKLAKTPETLDIGDLRSITFCDTCAYLEKEE